MSVGVTQTSVNSNGQSITLPEGHTCLVANGEACIPCRKRHLLMSRINTALKAAAGMLTLLPELNTEVNRVHSPFISRMPAEISSYIFLFCIPEKLPPPGSVTTDRRMVSARLNLGAICRTWRQVAWSTPKLWNFISIRFRPDKFPMRDELVKEWLGRSGQLPLSICVYVDHRDDNGIQQSTPNFRSVIQILNGYSSRWEYLSLRIPSFLISHFLGDSRDAGKLHTLHILPDICDDDEENERFSLTNAKPRPKNVAISHFRLRSIHIHWNVITHVNAYELHVDECLQLLQRAPQLTHCKLTGIVETRSYFPLPDNPVVHRRLRDLEVEFGGTYEDSDLEQFFKNMTLPSITRFACSMCDGSLPEELLVSFFQRSSCRLRTLCIADTVFEDEDLERLLGVIPSLWHLHLSSHVESSPFEEAEQNIFLLLADNSGTGEEPFLPQLRSLTYVAEPSFFWMNLLDIFGSVTELENPQRRPLKNLTVTIRSYNNGGCPIIPRHIVLRLAELKRAGFNLKIGLEGVRRDLLEYSKAFHRISEDDRS